MASDIVIIDYRAGNLTSVQLALQSLGVTARITSDPRALDAASRIIFPGVGAAGAAMSNLDALGFPAAIRAAVARGIPFLGICLGTQITLAHSEEDGGVDCLGLLPGNVVRFRPGNAADKVPHMGWNRVRRLRNHPVFEGIPDESEFYFVHSYYPQPADADCRLGETTYADVAFSSVIGRGNLVATQFHPEKSGRLGLNLLKNFLAWEPGRC